jgi:2-methylisocitrate lyase-like PEP mutase family enzyme
MRRTELTHQHDKGLAFRALHARPGAFIIANAWDAGSARLLEQAGFGALATTSAGFAFSIGRQDNQAGREAILRNAADIVAAADLPVSADLESGFGTTPNEVADTIRLAGSVGLVGGSIEDSTHDPSAPLLPVKRAAELVRAAAEAAHALPFPFALTARAENFLVGRPDLADAIARLQAYQEAGADVLYAPGLSREEDIRSVVRSVDRPVNVIMGLASVSFSVSQLSELGVKRISVGSALARRAYGALVDAAREMREHGSFAFGKDAPSHARFTEWFAQ